MKATSIQNFLFSLLLLTTISACSRSSSGGGSSDTPSQFTGRFVGTPVSGLQYSTDSGSGETNANGEFQYQAGEVIRFSVGNIVIGEVLGADTVSPFDLADLVPPQTALEIHRVSKAMMNDSQTTALDIVANIAVFLETLDEDGDAGNGIKIPELLHGLAATVKLDFNQPWSRFRRDFSFRKLLAAGRAEGLWGGTRAMRNTAYALDALYAGPRPNTRN